MDHAQVMNSCADKEERVGLALLNAAERIVFLVSAVNFEVELGGLTGFFFNSAGDHSAVTVAALEAVGAVHATAALKAAMALFPGGSPPTDREQRYIGWKGLSGRLLGQLDEEFGQDQPDVFSRLCEFIDMHAAELREHDPAV